jgi:hypothetical protein
VSTFQSVPQFPPKEGFLTISKTIPRANVFELHLIVVWFLFRSVPQLPTKEAFPPTSKTNL